MLSDSVEEAGDPAADQVIPPRTAGKDEKAARPSLVRHLPSIFTRLAVVLAVLAALQYYIGARLIGDAGLRGAGAIAAWLVVWLVLASAPLGVLFARFFPRWIARPLRAISHIWLGLFGVTLSAIVVTDVVRVLANAFGRAPLDRVWFGELQAIVVLVVVGLAGSIGFRTARGPARVERLRFPVTGLGRAFEGFRIVQISDLHITLTQDPKILARIIDKVNALAPDLVAITGDLIDGDVKDLRPHVAPLANLRASEGVFFVTGNHEYYHGADAWSDEVRRLGITVLQNEHRVVRRSTDGLVVAGVTDYSGGQFHPDHESRPDAAFAGAPDGLPRILLAHQPRTAARAASEKVDLQLSGHTHGGQIFPFMFFVRLQQPVVSGLKKVYGLWVYTSRGTGYWGPPFRVGPTPEITQIELVAALERSKPGSKARRSEPG
jgi:predicted MPP superfamily phosphohydrolase